MKKGLLYALRSLRAEITAGIVPLTGICGYVVNHPPSRLYLDDLQAMWVSWPRFSGDLRFPVPAFNLEGAPMARVHAQYAFGYAMFDAEKLYGDHPYGAARRELLDWLIVMLEATV